MSNISTVSTDVPSLPIEKNNSSITIFHRKVKYNVHLATTEAQALLQNQRTWMSIAALCA